MRYRFLPDRAMEEFRPDSVDRSAEFRSTAHDLVLALSYSEAQVDPRHRGPVVQTLAIDIDRGGRSQLWQLVDRNRGIENYRIGLAPARIEGEMVLVVQRAGKDGQVHTTLRVLSLASEDQVTELPTYRGTMWSEAGEDADGDGTIEFMIPDARFASLPQGELPGAAPPLVFAQRQSAYIDASRDRAFIVYYRGLLSQSADDCLTAFDDEGTGKVRASDCATYAALSARAGNWTSASHTLSLIGNRIGRPDWPRAAPAGGWWAESVAQQLTDWGYLPRNKAVRWWTSSWTDFYGDERDGAIPFEIRQLIHDWQGCDHFSNEPTDRPDGTTNEFVVSKIEEYCDRHRADSEVISLDEVRNEWLADRYREDDEARYLLLNLDNFLDAD